MPEITQEELDRLQAEAAEATKLKKNQSEQNSYITKLEKENQGLKTQAQNVQKVVNQPAAIDPVLLAHLKEERQEKVVGKATADIIEQYGQAVYDELSKEFGQILKENLTDDNTTRHYITKRFALLVGEHIGNPESTVYKLLTGQPAEPNTVEPTPPIIQDTEPPMMNNNDHNSASNPDLQDQNPVTNTDDAFKRFDTRLAAHNQNNFR